MRAMLTIDTLSGRGKDMIIKKCQLGEISKDEENVTVRRLVSKTTTGAWLRDCFQKGKEMVTLNEICAANDEKEKQERRAKKAEAEASKKASIEAEVPTDEDTGATFQSGEEATKGAESDNKRGKTHLTSDSIATTAPMHIYPQMRIEERTCLPPRHRSSFWRIFPTGKLILYDTNKERPIPTIEILSECGPTLKLVRKDCPGVCFHAVT
jgi:hypothetical protein